MSAGKVRYFTFLLYPESIPENWGMELELVDTPMVTSPLYDEGKSNVEGQECKKAHCHVIYIAINSATTHSVRKRIQRVLGSRSVVKIQVIRQSMENMYSYLTYESRDAIAKNKHRYAKKDIKLLSNFDIDKYMVFDVEGKEGVSNDVCGIIDDRGLANIKELRCFVKEHGSDYNLPSMKITNSILRSHTGLIRLHFDAVYQEREYRRSYVNTHTGEIKR